MVHTLVSCPGHMAMRLSMASFTGSTAQCFLHFGRKHGQAVFFQRAKKMLGSGPGEGGQLSTHWPVAIRENSHERKNKNNLPPSSELY